MINYARDHSTKEALDYIALWQTGMFARGHMAEAFKAQQEKRAPQYPDLREGAEGAVEQQNLHCFGGLRSRFWGLWRRGT